VIINQIDPIGCSCTECLRGEHVPLNMASNRQIDAMIAGKVRDATEMSEIEFDLYCNKRFGY